MAHLVTTHNRNLPLFFNIDANVGKGCANSPEDVALVSFLLVKWAEHGTPVPQGVVQQVKVGGTYKEALQALIDSLQRELKKVRPDIRLDGHVSKAVGNVHYRPDRSFMICQANAQIGMRYSSEWPRLDKIPGCPGEVRALVSRVVLVNV